MSVQVLLVRMLHMCSVHMCGVHMCGVHMCDVHMCDVHMCDVHMCDVHMCDVHMCSVHMCDVHMCGVHTAARTSCCIYHWQHVKGQRMCDPSFVCSTVCPIVTLLDVHARCAMMSHATPHNNNKIIFCHTGATTSGRTWWTTRHRPALRWAPRQRTRTTPSLATPPTTHRQVLSVSQLQLAGLQACWHGLAALALRCSCMTVHARLLLMVSGQTMYQCQALCFRCSCVR
jgi:hypothetical protein